MIDILEQITRMREERGWSEYALAERADLPQSTISSWYKKKMLPSLVSLEKICNAFDMSMSQFLAGDNEAFPLDSDQQELLDKWAQLSKEQKLALLKLLQAL